MRDTFPLEVQFVTVRLPNNEVVVLMFDEGETEVSMVWETADHLMLLRENADAGDWAWQSFDNLQATFSDYSFRLEKQTVRALDRGPTAKHLNTAGVIAALANGGYNDTGILSARWVGTSTPESGEIYQVKYRDEDDPGFDFGKVYIKRDPTSGKLVGDF